MKILARLTFLLWMSATTVFAETSLSVAPKSPNLSDMVSLTTAWELTGFSMPESAVTALDHPWIYVSNVNGDAPGFISRVSKDGKIDALKWVEIGGSPTGLALYEGRLYAGNSTQVDIIEVGTGEILDPIRSDIAKTLNDVTIAQDGTLYVSDVIGGKVYALQNGSLEEIFSTSELAHPNGVLIDDTTLYVGDTAGGLSPDFSPDTYGSVYKVDLSDNSYHVVPTAEKLGAVDGITRVGDVMFASSNQTGELFAFSDRERILLGVFKPGLADIGVFGELLLAPFLFDNTVIGFNLKITK